MTCKNIKWLLSLQITRKDNTNLHSIDAVKNTLKTKKYKKDKNWKLHKYSNCGNISQALSLVINAEATIHISKIILHLHFSLPILLDVVFDFSLKLKLYSHTLHQTYWFCIHITYLIYYNLWRKVCYFYTS